MKIIDTFVNKIIRGDCTNVMQNMPSESVDLIVTDPPYLVNYRSRDGRGYPNDDNSRWLKPASQEMYRVLKNNRFCVSFYGWSKVERFMLAWKKAGFVPVGHFACVKNYASNQKFTRYYHENAYLLAKGEPPPPAHPLRDVVEWRHYTGNTLHPTQKPVEVLESFIEVYSSGGDIVLDPFAGSGTTAVASHKLGRRYIGIELDEQYCTVAQSRMNHYQHNNQRPMGYIQDIERDIKELLCHNDPDDVVNFVKEKVLESYKNGLRDGKKPRKQSETKK